MANFDNNLGTNPKKPVAALLVRLFQAWSYGEVRYLVLRNYESLPEDTGNDVDVLIAPEQLSEAVKIMLSAAAETGWKMHNHAEFACWSFYFYHEQTGQQIHIDLMCGLRWHSFVFADHAAMLAARTPYKSFFIPHPTHEASVNLLTRLLYGGYVRDKYRSGIQSAAREHKEQISSFISPWLGAVLTANFVEWSQAADWEKIEKSSGAVRKQVIKVNLKQPLRTFRQLLHDAIRLAKRFFRPPGICIAFIGPDGSGKTTVAKGVAEALSGTFSPQRTFHYHWKPLPPKGGDVAPTTDPHSKPPRILPLSLIYFGWHWLGFVYGWWRHVQPVLFRNGLVMIDRYYYDFFVDQRRYRLNLPTWIYKFAFCFIRKPDLVIYLDAPVTVLQSRKVETTPAECQRQVDAYKALIKQIQNSHLIDNNGHILQAVCQVRDIVLSYMSTRTLFTE